MKIIWQCLLLFIISLQQYGEAKSINSKQLNDNKKAFDFDEIIPNKFGQRGFSGTWISSREFTYTSSGNFVKFNIEQGTNETILTKEFVDAQGWSGPTFRMSPDNTKILVRYNNRQIFRHSTVSRFSILFVNSNQPEYKIADGEEIQLCFFAPSDDGVAYIYENNIYYVKFEGTNAMLPEIITQDGVPNIIYNGIPDWVYEEEVLGGDAASWFSPNGRQLAFVKFDDTEVKEAVYDLYGENDQQYPEQVHLRYPKVGTNNPVISLNIFNIQTRIRGKLETPTKVTTEHILGTVFWIDNQNLGAIWLNRRQNYGLFVSYDIDTYVMTEIMEFDEPNGWIDLNTPKCDDAGICYFIDDFENWPTLTKVNTKNKQDIQRLSGRSMNVLSFYGVQNGNYYYASTPSGDESWNRHTYSKDGCLTCNIETPEGNNCTYVSTTFSKDFSYYTMTCSGPDPAFSKIYRTSDKVEVYLWEDNSVLRNNLTEYDIPQTKNFLVPIDGGFKAAVRMIVPSSIDFDGTTTKEKHPMLVRVYAGPGSVRIQNTFSIGFQTYQVTTKKIIYVEIDGRGTGNKGNDLMFSINNKLGTYEMEDQIAVTKYLVDKYDWIDGSRVGIWGWSYGGYATAMTLAKDVDKVFQCGISVAPVTSWRFYDTIYTERYMGVDPNATNYVESDVATLEHIEQLGKHDFFLIHGNADDNVHYQQSMVLARELELQDILFEQMSYPDEAHGLTGVQRHLYHSMDRFWNKCFKL